MSEKLLVLEAQSDGRVVVVSGSAPPGVPIAEASALGPSRRGRRVQMVEWIPSATNALLKSLLSDSPPAEAARWWAKVSQSDAKAIEKKRLEFARILRDSRTDIENKIASDDARAELQLQYDQAKARMEAYANALTALTTRCVSTLASAAEACKESVNSLERDNVSIAAASEQLVGASDAPMPAKAEKQWRERIKEVISEETRLALQRSKERSEQSCNAIQSLHVPMEQDDALTDPTRPFFGSA